MFPLLLSKRTREPQLLAREQYCRHHTLWRRFTFAAILTMPCGMVLGFSFSWDWAFVFAALLSFLLWTTADRHFDRLRGHHEAAIARLRAEAEEYVRRLANLERPH
jgi:thiosulfate reductase cytochrome b subunit